MNNLACYLFSLCSIFLRYHVNGQEGRQGLSMAERVKQFKVIAKKKAVFKLNAMVKQRQRMGCNHALEEFPRLTNSSRYYQAFAKAIFLAVVGGEEGEDAFALFTPVIMHLPPKGKPKDKDARLYRTCAATFLYFIISVQSSRRLSSLDVDAILVGLGGLIGWYATSAALLCMAIKGIIQERAILLYPYIVVLIAETLIIVIVVVYSMIILASAWPILHILIAPGINTYAAICLSSLSRHFNNYDRRYYASSYGSTIAAL